MKLKAVLSSASVVAISALALAGCGSSSSSSSSSSKKSSSSSSSAKTTKVAKLTAGSKMKAGTYKLEEQNYSHGYKVKMSITVNKDGKITSSTYDQVNKDGKSKVDDTDYNKQMKKVSGTNPKAYIPKLNKSLTSSKVATGNVGAIDVVSGATESSKTFQNYTQQLVQAAQAGKTDTIKIDNGAKMQDGTYKLEEKNYSHNYKVTFAITVKDGKITESNYDNVNKDGKSKVDDTDYNKQMKKVAKTNPKAYQPALNKSLVKNSDPAKVDVVTGATESSNTFVLYAEQLQNAAQKGDTNTITVDNMIFSE
ncbi:extracellular electron transfer flavoprotein PplA [Lactiplantibacillus modestisalitolerans]|uniref:Extracellular electron transfer flavoprotein PplA n=1 Tax=Lactiplantibacillus modestisalitolerans TaxID=1457219 RepID=A0ABV5WVN4_9LACO|nr:extracellular electron transfer flavoprotein PplA [Lactiplantibacillus modestisalitolerans]